MKVIDCVCGRAVFLDDDAPDLVLRRRWNCNHSNVLTNDGISIAHLIIGTPPLCHVIDHINRDIHDNRKVNLRFATHSQNQGNRKVCKNKPIQYKGVFRRRTKEVYYYAAIRKDGVLTKLGNFRTPEEAALAYNEKAKEVFGPFALLNVVPS